MAQGDPKHSRGHAERGPRQPERLERGTLEDGIRDPALELRRAIEDSRQKITDNLDIIQEEVEDRLDWRGWVREHPWEAVGVAFCVGLFLGARPYL